MKNSRPQKLGYMMVFALIFSMLVALTGCGGASKTTVTTTPSTEAPAATAAPIVTAAPSTDAPAPTEAPAKKVTLSFWNGFTGPDGELLKTIVDDYNKINADKIEIKMDILPWDQLGQKLPLSISTNTAPSFVGIIAATSTAYIAKDSFQDVNDFFTVSGANEADFSPGSLKLADKGDKHYLLPMQTNGLYLFWNKALFKAANLDPEKAPESLDQLAEYAVKLTDAGKGQFGFGMAVKGAPAYYVSFIRGNGGEVVDMNTKKSVLNSPENVKTFEWIQDLVKNKKVMPKGAAGADLEKLMFSGKLGMVINGPWMSGGLKGSNIDYGVAVPPKGSVKQATELGGIGFAIPKSTTPEQKAAIYDFIKYWNTTEISKKWSLSNGNPPYLNSVMNDPDVKANANISAMANMGDSAQTFLQGLNSADRINNDVLLPLIEAVESGQKVSDAVAKASNTIDDLLLKAEK